MTATEDKNNLEPQKDSHNGVVSFPHSPKPKKRLYLIIFCILFAATGSYFIIRSFAATDVAPGQAKKVTLEGTLERIIFDDRENEKSKEEFFLKTDDGKKLKLAFPGKGPELLGGSKVRVTGDQTGETIILAESGGNSVTTVSAATVTPVTATRKVAVVLLNFTDDTSQPFTPESAKNDVFTGSNSVRSFYQRNSQGAFNIIGNINPDGDVFGWITINQPKGTGCGYSLWSQAADEALQAQGIDMSVYNHVIYSFPQSICGFGGIAQLPGNKSWNNGSLTPVIHEFGHNLGLSHANSYDCKDPYGFSTDVSDNCISNEYGDPYDVMGTRNEELNAYHREQLGWLNSSNYQTVTASGDYTIDALGSNSTAVKVIKIARNTSRKTVTSYYYLEYRPGTDATDVTNRGVLLREISLYNSNSNIFDTAPETRDYARMLDSPLSIGRTFNEATRKISITPISEASGQVKVRISIGRTTASADNAACVTNTAPIGVMPSGSSFNASVTMKNTGTTTWKAYDYQLAAMTYPANVWGISRLQLNGDVPPGGTATFTNNFTPPGRGPSGIPELFDWRMVKVATSDWFGQACLKPVAVDSYPTPLPAPTNLRSTSTSASTVSLAWDPIVLPNQYVGVYLYKILRTSGGVTYLAGKSNITPTLFNDGGLKSGTSYTYRVVGIGLNGLDSLQSEPITVTTAR